MRWQTRLRHLWLALLLLPRLLTSPPHRALLRQMRQLNGRLPQLLQDPLPQAMAQLAMPTSAVPPLPEKEVRQLADLAALLARRSPLGICLRRSLVRYPYLRQIGLPVEVQFGARFDDSQAGRKIAGHAWVTLNQVPYYEDDENWQNFKVIYRWPAASE